MEDEKLYLVGYTTLGDNFVSMAKFQDISNAFLFIEAYFEKCYQEPNMSLTILRVNKDRVVEHHD